RIGRVRHFGDHLRICAISLALRNAIYIEHGLSHEERVAGNTDQPLHQRRCGIVPSYRLVRLIRRNENHHVATTRFSESGQTAVAEWDMRAIDRLVDEEPVADKQRRHHAARGYAIGLDEERAQDEKDRQRADDRFEILPDATETGVLRNGARLLSAPRV